MDTQTPSKYILPFEVVQNLNCSYCLGYLSCGPIKMVKNKYICGRCTVSKEDEVILQPLFECAMGQFKFPCKFDKEGCLEQIPFNYAQVHEPKCIYRIISCPALNCTNTISVSKIYQHFQSHHSSCIMENDQIRLDLLTSDNGNFLIYESDSIVIVNYHFSADIRQLQFSVVPILERNRRIDKYRLQIISGNDFDCTVSLSARPCHAYNSSVLIVGDYDIYNIDLSILNNPTFVFINIFLLFRDSTAISDESQINCEADEVTDLTDVSEENAIEVLQHICYDENSTDDEDNTDDDKDITDGNTNEESNEAKNDNSSGDNNDENNVGNSDEVIDEHVTNIPCRWKRCNEFGDMNRMLSHIDKCKFKLYVCPFLQDCEEGLFKFNAYIRHLKTHALHCPDPSKIIIPLFSANIFYTKEKVYQYFTILNGHIIQLKCTVSPDDWKLVCFGPIKIRVNTYLTHDHCRLTIKEPEKYAKFIEYEKTTTTYRKCFNKFPRLKAVLKIDI